MIKLPLYLIWSDGSATTLLAIEVAVGYHRASSLSRYYIKYVGYTSEGIHEYLNAF
jgi:transcriptional regulator GlxA family with amidase domain